MHLTIFTFLTTMTETRYWAGAFYDLTEMLCVQVLSAGLSHNVIILSW